MLKTLFVRPHPFDIGKMQWGIFQDNRCIESSDGFVGAETLDLEGDFYEVVCIAPSARMFSTQVHLPNVNARMLNRALPYAIEEKVAEDVEDLHLTVLGKEGKNDYVVNAVAHDLMQEWLKQAEAPWGPISQMVIDALCLPEKDKFWSVLIEDDHALVKLDASTGLYVERENLVHIMEALYQEASAKPEMIRIYLPDADGEKLLVASIENHLAAGAETAIEVQDYQDSLSLFAHGFEEQELVSLLQGAYRPVVKKENKAGPWKLPLSVAAAWLLFSVASNWYQATTVDHQAKAVKKASLGFFRELFPERRRAPRSLKREMQSELDVKEGSAGNASFVRLLAGVGEVKRNAPFDKMIIKAVRFNESRGGLFLEMTGESVADFEGLKTALISQGMEAELASVSSQQGIVFGRVRVGGANG